MKPNMQSVSSLPRRSQAAQTLAEIVVALAIVGFVFATLYAGISQSFSVVRTARENLRATQILEEKMEVIRLMTFDQVSFSFVPRTFTALYDASSTNSTNNSMVYTGTVTITNAPVSEAYSNDLKMVQIDLTWSSGNVSHTRQMTTFVSQVGMQGYLY
jgi:type II secretory pathway pseudopilin PulG